MEKENRDYVDKLSHLRLSKLEQRILKSTGYDVSRSRQNVENRKKVKKHGILKGIKKFFVRMGGIVGVSLLLGGAYAGIHKLSAKEVIDSGRYQHAHQEVASEQNKNITPGYYNEHPLKVCISNNFTELQKAQIVSGIKYLDRKAEGLKFEYYFGDSQNSEADIKIHDKVNQDENSTVVAYANLGSRETERIRGNVTIYTNKFHSMGMRATVIHELCHVLGLEHSENTFSIMSPVICSFFMNSEDVKQINALYPPAEKTSNNIELYNVNNDLSK